MKLLYLYKYLVQQLLKFFLLNPICFMNFVNIAFVSFILSLWHQEVLRSITSFVKGIQGDFLKLCFEVQWIRKTIQSNSHLEVLTQSIRFFPKSSLPQYLYWLIMSKNQNAMYHCQVSYKNCDNYGPIHKYTQLNMLA